MSAPTKDAVSSSAAAPPPLGYPRPQIPGGPPEGPIAFPKPGQDGGYGKGEYFQYINVPGPKDFEWGYNRGAPEHNREQYFSQKGHTFKSKLKTFDSYGGNQEHYYDINHSGPVYEEPAYKPEPVYAPKPSYSPSSL